jgi:uncharacterized protein YchJ
MSNKQQTEINAVEYLGKVNQFAKENNTGKPKQQTAVEWLNEQLQNNIHHTIRIPLDIIQQAKEMEKEQTIEFAINYTYGTKRVGASLKEDFIKLYEQTYGDDKQ